MAVPIFASNIERYMNADISGLYDLLHNEPAKPKVHIKEHDPVVELSPRTGKIYKPKTKHSHSKVKTVADIRREYEEDVMFYLPDDLNKSEKYFLNKVSCGSYRYDSTRRLARKIARMTSPISRKTWQIITNLNPDKKLHPLQYVLWDGICIRVNGSRGGSKKFVVNCDLYKKKINDKNTLCKANKQKKSLLQKSLSIKFKPGPLKKKTALDYSYQKFNVGSTELIQLPRIGLEVEPSYGAPIESTISQVLLSLREFDGKLTDKWAEFSVCALGKVTDSTMQLETKSITFDLDYKNDQNMILMRRDNNQSSLSANSQRKRLNRLIENKQGINKTVHEMIGKILDCVEINVLQNECMKYDPDDRKNTEIEVSLETSGHQIKDKLKRKYGELEKLDITVIRIPDTTEECHKKKCDKPFCTLGCVCSSLEYRRQFKQHCGRPECMLKCKCEVTKLTSKRVDGNLDILPGLFNLDNEINSKLTKEEQKFHQTVLVREDKTFLLKPQRRNTKAPKRYAEYYAFENRDVKINKILTINLLKIPCSTIEPWCMVHNLYRCFCEGKFLNSNASSTVITNNSELPKKSVSENSVSDEEIIEKFAENMFTTKHRNDDSATKYNTCARIRRYVARKYDDFYYESTRKKIKKMEQNDITLNEKLMQHINTCLNLPTKSEQERNSISDSTSEKDSSDITMNHNVDIESPPENDDDENSADNYQAVTVDISNEALNNTTVVNNLPVTNVIPKNMPDMGKLIKWLEESYKFYKPRIETGQNNFPLEAPKLGKIALYPWEVILDRYNSKKNYFLVTKSEPYRIFMAINLADTSFANCIKIEDLKFEEVPKYPITVRNLILDASDLKDSFYILSGLANCWELIGHVTKLGVNNNDCPSVKPKQQLEGSIAKNIKQEHKLPDLIETNDQEKCRWFLMLVGNDFKEILFNNKGFFIKYDNIMKAIKVARLSGKTVRLSSQKSHGFGIHATPIKDNSCIFIGPYDIDEALGFETVDSFNTTLSCKKSKGFWIHTDRVENTYLINNPIIFIKQTCKRLGGNLDDLVCDLDSFSVEKKTCSGDITDKPDENVYCSPKRRHSFDEPEGIASLPKLLHADPYEKPSSGCSDVKDIIQPIKLKKSGSVYKVSPNIKINRSSLLKVYPAPFILNKPPDLDVANTTESFLHPQPIIQNTFSLVGNSLCNVNIKNLHNKPVAEIAPQRKLVVFPESNTDDCSVPKSESGSRKDFISSSKGMLILNPDEINKRLLESKTTPAIPMISPTGEDNHNKNDDDDIESFLTTHNVLPSCDAVIIAESEAKVDDSERISEIVIECKTFDIGWIRGKIDDQGCISFALPGFKFTEFYPPIEAFAKINQVLARKVYIPSDILLEWKYTVRKYEDYRQPILSYNFDLKKLQQTKKLESPKKSFAERNLDTFNEPSTSWSEAPADDIEKLSKQTTSKVISDLEEEGRRLEKESHRLEEEKDSLQSSVLLKNSELLKLMMQVPTEVREKIFNLKK